MKWIVSLTFLHSRAHTLLGQLIPCLAPSTKRASGFPSQPCTPWREGAQITLKSGFESVAASANPVLFSQSSSEKCGALGERCPGCWLCTEGTWMDGKTSSGENQVVTKELQELQSDRKENPACKCGVLLDGAPLPSLLKLEKRRCCEDSPEAMKDILFQTPARRSGPVLTEFNSYFNLAHFRNILVFQH